MKTLDFVGMVCALMTAGLTVMVMLRWPPGRDPRPLAPGLALAIAYFILKLHPFMGWEDAYNWVRDYAWRIWHIVVFAELILFIYLQSRERDRCGLGGACAEKRGRNLTNTDEKP